MAGTLKMRTYTITTGVYDSYRIVAWLSGPETPAITTLYNEFKTEFFPDYQENLKVPTDIAGLRVYNKNLDYKYDAMKRMHNAGYKGDGIVDVFINWLKDKHKFVSLKNNEVWIES